MSHRHYCGVEAHEWQCSEATCDCICGNLMESGADHGECFVELRDCPEHQGQLSVSSDDELSSGINWNLPRDAEKARCGCGCAEADHEAVVGFCVWCSHVYVSYDAKIEAQHFLYSCPEARAELREAARLNLGRLN